MRRELAIKVDYLDARPRSRSSSRAASGCIDPWAHRRERDGWSTATRAVPAPAGDRRRPRRTSSCRPAAASASSWAGAATFADLAERAQADRDRQQIIADLLAALAVAGLVEAVDRRPDDRRRGRLPDPGRRACVWVAGDGTRAFHDPIRVPRAPEDGGRTNPFFVDFYRTVAGRTPGPGGPRAHRPGALPSSAMSARSRFREAKLPVLYCSPTMELGVDIADLNVVNLRNVPPTPANYAQRSGRAGRSGQPALVVTYCSTGSPHDQYFFRRPARMVAGAGHAAAAGPGQRGPGARPRPGRLAGRDRR